MSTFCICSLKFSFESRNIWDITFEKLRNTKHYWWRFHGICITVKGKSFEKEVLMLKLTEDVFLWNKYFDHLKNFMLLPTDSVLMQAIYFFAFLHLQNEVAVKWIFDKTCIEVFLKKHYFLFSAAHANENFSKMKHHNFFKYHLKLLEAGCSCFSKCLIKMKKFTWMYNFTLLIGPSKTFMEAVKAFIKLVETPQWSLKIKN